MDEWEELQKNDYARTLVIQNGGNKQLKKQFEELTDRILKKEREDKAAKIWTPCSKDKLETWRESVVGIQ